jgi:hypothetical protein
MQPAQQARPGFPIRNNNQKPKHEENSKSEVRNPKQLPKPEEAMTETRLFALRYDRAENVHQFLRFLHQSVALDAGLTRRFN